MCALNVLVLGAHKRTEGIEIGERVRVWATGAHSRVRALVEGYRLARTIVRDHPVDIISTQDPFECALIGYLLKRRTSARLQIQEHGDFFSQPYWRRERILHQLRYVVGVWLIHHADCIRVVSERIKRGLTARGIAEDRIAVSPLWTDIEGFRTVTPHHEIANLRPDGGVLILTMARFVPQKNLQLLVSAFRRVVAQGVKARLVLLGQGPDKQQLLDCSQDLIPNHVTFLDWTDDPAGAMKAADIYALSSDYEGWGRVCIEALAAGTPLLMTDVGCAGEVVQNEKNGLVVPVRDEQAFADALLRLATEATLRARLAVMGSESVRHLPNKEDQLESYRKSLECCIVQPHESSETDQHEDRRSP